MKLAVIANYWLGSKGGGIVTSTSNLVYSLKENGVEVEVFYRKGSDRNHRKLPENRIRFVKSAVKHLITSKPDVILCNEGAWYTCLPAVIYKKNFSGKRKVKIFPMFRTAYMNPFPIPKRFFYNFILNKCDKIGFVSKGLERNVREVAKVKFKRKTFVIYSGVEVKHPRKRDIKIFQKKFNLSVSNILILSHGFVSLYGKKEGAKILMRAFKKIIKKHPEARLVITRKGKYLNELIDFSKDINIEKNVVFTSELSNPHVATSICDIYAHITNSDGLPNALLEAMAFGRPIVASNLFGIPEAVTHEKEALLVKNDVKEVYSSIIRLIEDPKLREKLGENAKKRAKDQFTWEKTVDSCMQVFK